MSGSFGTGGLAATGGNSAANTAACNSTSDCTNCMYKSAPTSSSDCYCAPCAATPMNVDTCNANEAAYDKFCLVQARTCVAIPCVAPASLMCDNGTCVPKGLPN